MQSPDDAIAEAAALLAGADGLLVATGAGMGVDSGLPDFRGVRRLAVIEPGAGVDVPSVRRMAEAQGVPVIRVNPRAADVRNGVGLEMGALAAMQSVATALALDLSQIPDLND